MTADRDTAVVVIIYLWMGLFALLLGTFVFAAFSTEACVNQPGTGEEGNFCDHLDYGFVTVERPGAETAFAVGAAAVFTVAMVGALVWLICGWNEDRKDRHPTGRHGHSP